MARVVVFEYQGKGLEKLLTNQDELKKAIKETQIEVSKSDFGSDKYNKANAQLQALKNTQKDVREENKLLQKQMTVTADKGKQSYTALTANLKVLETQFFQLGKAERRSAIGQDLAKRIRSLRSEVRGINADLGKRGLTGSLTRAFAVLGGAGLVVNGVTEAVGGLARFVGDAVNTFADFNRQVSFLGAVSGATSEELEELKQQSRDLGETTQFTASQVAGLQIEYAKLGFSPSEILDATADSLNLAAVAQAELSDVARVTGATIRSFNLEASEANRVSDVLAQSFSSSALDLSKFETAFAQLGPVAANAGLSLEETVALMGVLADRGVDASTIGSGLRNVFLDLAKGGLTLDEALTQINEASDSNVASLDLFGKRGATIGAILAGTRDQVADLTQELIKADEEGFSKIAGDKITSDLRGTFDRVGSAIEGFKLNLIDLIDGPLQSFLEFIARAIGAVSTFLNILQALPKFIKENSDIIGGLALAFIGLNSAAIAANATILITNARTLAMTAAQKGAAVATQFLTVAQKGLNVALRSNPIGLIISAVGILIALFGTLRRRSRTVEATFQGLKAIGVELFTIFQEGFAAFGRAVEEFGQGNIRKGLKAAAEGFSKFNPVTIAFNEGGRLASAFNEGYKESSAELEEAQKVQEQVSDAADRSAEIQGKLSEATNETAAATSNLTSNLEKAAIATDNFAIGSVAQLRKELRDLNKQLNESSTENAQGILSKILKAEEALDEVEAFQDLLRSRLAGEGTFGALDPIGQAQIEATKSTTDEILEEYRKRNQLIQTEQRDLTGFFQGLQEEIFSGIDRANDFLSDASQERTNNEISGLEDRYQTEIDLAEGNTRRQEALREELAMRTAELEREEFERQKRFRVASALSSLAQGVVNILSSPTTIPDPFGAIYKGVRIGLLTGTTLAQIATINRQTAARGIVIDEPQRMDSGGFSPGFARGATHADASGGINKIFNGQRVLIEHGEFSDRTEDGGIAVVNKRSSAAFKNTLSRVKGKTFPGKRALLSNINSYKNWGIRYAQDGDLIEPSIRSIASAASSGSAISGGSIAAIVTEDSAGMIAGMTAQAVETVILNTERQKERERLLKKRTGI